MVRHQLPLHRS